MSAQAIVGTMRAVARDEVAARWHPAIAVVTSAHGGEQEHACTVKLRESNLVLPKVPIASGLLGAAALPAEGDLVVIVFAGGDLHAPVVVGRLYDDEIAPPDHQPGELIASLPGGETDKQKALQVAIRTPGDGTRRLEITLAGSSGAEVSVAVSDDAILLTSRDTTLELAQSGSSDGKATLKVGDSSIVVEQGGDVTITATGALTLKGSTVEIDGDTSVKVAGQTIDLN